MREFRCKSCGRKLVIPDDFTYRRARCPSCRTVVEVPPTPPGEAEQVTGADRPPRAAEAAPDVQEPLEKPDPALGPRAHLPEQIVRVLRQDEKVIYWGRPSWVVLAMREAWLVLSVLIPAGAAAKLLSYAGVRSVIPPMLLAAFLIIVILGALLFWSWRNTVYILTSHRLLTRAGILAVNVVSMPLVKVKSISLYRGLIQRLFGLGSLRMST